MDTQRQALSVDDEARVRLNRAIGKRIRTQRAALGLSLAQLSERTSGRLIKSRISNYEQGLRRMGIEEAQILAHAFTTVSPAWLLCIDEAETTVPVSAAEAELLMWLRATDDRGKRLILASARATGDECVAASKE